MAAPRFWLASSSKSPRWMAVVRSLVAPRAGKTRRQRTARSTQVLSISQQFSIPERKWELPSFRMSAIIFIRVLFNSFRTHFDGFAARRLSPCCKIGMPANHAKPMAFPARKREVTILFHFPSPHRPATARTASSKPDAGALLRRCSGVSLVMLRWGFDGVTMGLGRSYEGIRCFFPLSQVEFIADTMHGLEPAGRIRVTLELAAQAGNVVIHRASGWESGVAPDCVEEPLAGNGFARRLSHQPQHGEFLGRQMERLAATRGGLPDEGDVGVTPG